MEATNNKCYNFHPESVTPLFLGRIGEQAKACSREDSWTQVSYPCPGQQKLPSSYSRSRKAIQPEVNYLIDLIPFLPWPKGRLMRGCKAISILHPRLPMLYFISILLSAAVVLPALLSAAVVLPAFLKITFSSTNYTYTKLSKSSISGSDS